MADEIELEPLKRKEGKEIEFFYKDAVGDPIDVSTATFSLVIKRHKDEEAYLVQKQDGDFDKSEGANGIATVVLTPTNLDLEPGIYVGEIECNFGLDVVDRSKDLIIKIEKPVHHPVP